MAQNTPNRAVPGIGLANTVRFAWKEKEMETFGRTILMGILKLAVKYVLWLQVNPMERAYDVTFHTEENHEIIMKVRALEGARPQL